LHAKQLLFHPWPSVHAAKAAALLRLAAVEAQNRVIVGTYQLPTCLPPRMMGFSLL
jgi:hypothetical protein